MEGEMFLTINPDTLNDEELWTYRDLQLISTQLGLKANLKRLKLVANLAKWHRGRTEDDKNLVPDKQDEENLEMNVIGNNFSLLAVNVNQKKNRKQRYSTSSRESLLIVDYEDGQFKVSPGKIQRFSTGTTPGKSILKNSSAPTTHDKKNSNRNSLTKKSSNICFSPFNGVKVITHRSDMMEYCNDLWIANILDENENDDDYSYCDDDGGRDSDEEENDDDDEDEDGDEEEEDDDGEDMEEDDEDENEIDNAETEMDLDEEINVYDYPIEYDIEF